MHTLPAKELKRRGLAAVEDLLIDGPVEVFKNNRPACVVLSIEDYRNLTKNKENRPSRDLGIAELFALPPQGSSQREELDELLRLERDSWSNV